MSIPEEFEPTQKLSIPSHTGIVTKKERSISEIIPLLGFLKQTSHHADLIERLSKLEYAIRQSMTVREDQDEPANLEQKQEAESCGIAFDSVVTKGDLLNLVQTLVRVKQKENMQYGTRNQSAGSSS